MGTHKNWFKAWHFDRATCKLWHDSGLVYLVRDDGADVDTDTLNAFYDFELERGVQKDQINARLLRLNREVQLWIEYDRK